MSSRYLNEIRLGEPLKTEIKTVIRDVSETFNVHGQTRTRPVPHITLFGPYDTDDGYEAKSRTQSVLQSFNEVPYEIDGFGHFNRETLYLNVCPSSELRSLRRRLSARLRPIADDYRDYDADREYDFHITIAFKDIQSQFDEIWTYVNETYNFERQATAKRVTALDGRDMMWEWDLPQGKALSQSKATSRQSWQKTEAALEGMQSTPTEENQPDKRGILQKILQLYR